MWIVEDAREFEGPNICDVCGYAGSYSYQRNLKAPFPTQVLMIYSGARE